MQGSTWIGKDSFVDGTPFSQEEQSLVSVPAGGAGAAAESSDLGSDEAERCSHSCLAALGIPDREIKPRSLDAFP